MHSQSPIEACSDLIKRCKSLVLATTSGDCSHSSYVPFIWVNDNVYILVSELAQHTGNLKQANRNKVGCMLIEDESEAEEIFARRRLMFKSTVVQITRDADQWPELMEDFKHRFGKIISLLDSLPDFTIFKLSPEQIVLVRGFGDAHQIKEALIN